MRVIAGAWRGRSLRAPKGLATRPTASRAREALFSILGHWRPSFASLRALDLFAGSGALGIEALSRGAASAVFVERDRRAVDALRRNLASLDADARVVVADARAFRPAGVFDLVFVDPPYGEGLAAEALLRLWEEGALAAGALIAIETARGEHLAAPEGLEPLRERDVGAARLRIYRAP